MTIEAYRSVTTVKPKAYKVTRTMVRDAPLRTFIDLLDKHENVVFEHNGVAYRVTLKPPHENVVEVVQIKQKFFRAAEVLDVVLLDGRCTYQLTHTTSPRSVYLTRVAGANAADNERSLALWGSITSLWQTMKTEHNSVVFRGVKVETINPLTPLLVLPEYVGEWRVSAECDVFTRSEWGVVTTRRIRLFFRVSASMDVQKDTGDVTQINELRLDGGVVIRAHANRKEALFVLLQQWLQVLLEQAGVTIQFTFDPEKYKHARVQTTPRTLTLHAVP